MALQLVTDRTQADVDDLKILHSKGYSAMTAAEKTLWNSGTMKGAYNFSDLNRVETAVSELALVLSELGFPTTVEVKTDWSLSAIPTVQAMARYLGNLNTLRSAVNVFSEITPELPTDMQHLNFDGANRIEQMLQRIEQWAIHMQSERKYSGELFCGE